MADKNSRWHHPHWHLVFFVMPLLIFLTIEDDRIMRFLMASSLTMAAIQYGRDSARWARDKAASNHDISS
ncbi:hypothetical protein [Streptomyces rhizosphaerihabitans]|uniref:hypothetical protein n=1 Tax=Streptomyces rhizosphaerihabitans TaxID=1266770 RepID=UPI0021C1CE5A|nr:hypothetical protein [Streptomyces rhizosphaerihabitans]MCT9005056.1 hypothetical protein [Streptomyces rhizosphaerihabitans]